MLSHKYFGMKLFCICAHVCETSTLFQYLSEANFDVMVLFSLLLAAGFNHQQPAFLHLNQKNESLAVKTATL